MEDAEQRGLYPPAVSIPLVRPAQPDKLTSSKNAPHRAKNGAGGTHRSAAVMRWK